MTSINSSTYISVIILIVPPETIRVQPTTLDNPYLSDTLHVLTYMHCATIDHMEYDETAGMFFRVFCLLPASQSQNLLCYPEPYRIPSYSIQVIQTHSSPAPLTINHPIQCDSLEMH